MNSIKSILRISVILFLLTAAAFLFLSLPEVDSHVKWLVYLVISKGLGALCILALARLYPRWRRIDPLVSRCHDWCMDGCDK
jgi:hypothetical protein